MNKMLVLAEKPSVGRDIARVLNCGKQGKGYFEGSRYIVTWALGHLVTLADPEVYDEKYKAWKLDELPMLPSPVKLVVIKKTRGQFNIVKEQLYRNDVREVVIATDAGREGELVARWILEKAKVKKPLYRLWISSVTDRAIKDGFMRLKDGKEYENLYASAQARAEADWFVGINATRALTCKYNAQLSCGRVQTPTVMIIASREDEIRNFKPKPFYGITAFADNLKLIWRDKSSRDYRTFDKDRCDEILKSLKGKNAVVKRIDKSHKRAYSPQLYDLTELQRDANKIFDFSAKETLSIMQSLYESHKILTYPRTDSRYISSDIVDTLEERIRACGVGPYSGIAFKVRGRINPSKHFVDDAKVSDHHAIIPTEQPVILSSLSDKERKIYDLVIKRFLAVLYPPFEYEATTIEAEIGSQSFIAKGKNIISQGWKEVYQNKYDEEDERDISEQNIPKLNEGDILNISSLSQNIGETKPPAPFTEATLLSAMENPIKYMNTCDKDLIKTMGEAGGLGTVATRADIIEKLFNTFLIEKRGKEIFTTSKGRQLLELVPEDLKSPVLTAQWEQKLTAISKGSLDKNVFIDDMKRYASELVGDIKNSEAKFKYDNLTRTKCPRCGKYMLEVKGKNGKMLICQDRECGYRENISRTTNARCPNCHKKLELYGEGENRIFICSCGYREKLKAFKERKKDNDKSSTKRDIAQYMKEQRKSQGKSINSSLAEALSHIKL